MLRPSSLPRAPAVVTPVGRPVLRPVLGAIAGAVILGVLGPVVAGLAPAGTHLTAPAAAEAPRDPSQPLVPHIRSITPDYIPDHGPIVVRGTLTNASHEQWTAINVHAFIGSAPITTTADLAAAVQTPVTADVGHRITTAGTFDHVDSLAPGESVHFTVRLPRDQLPVQAPGVYWFGVHALGATAQGVSSSAAGRDRTFLPLVPQADETATPPLDAALVVPLRAPVTRGADGTVQDIGGWLSELGTGGLASLVDLGRAAHGRPLTWLLDPAVTDAVQALAHGNPPLTLTAPGGSTAGGPSASPSPSTSSTPSSSASSSGSGTASTTDTSTETVARHWLHALHRVLANGTGEILGLPYGDLDVASAARYDRPYLGAVLRRTGHSLRPWKLPLSGTVIAPPTGRISGTVTTSLPRSTRILLSDRAVRGGAPVVNDVGGRRVVLASTGAAQGGPGPVNPLSPLALRQRILSEAALRFLGNQAPLVVELPADWHRQVPDSFFSGLDVPWLHLTTLDAATSGPPAPLSAARLRQPPPAVPALGPGFYAAVNRVLTESETLQSVLPGNHVLRRNVFDVTTGSTSYDAAADPFAALARVRATSRWVAAGLHGVTLAAPPSVTLTSTSGRFQVLVSNQLDVPVTVKVKAVADSQLTVTGGETIDLPAHGTRSVLLNASTHQLGVHTVTLQVTNQSGTPLGSSDSFPMRAEQVSQLIWVIIGAGLALLFGAIVVRLVRRIARSRG